MEEFKEYSYLIQETSPDGKWYVSFEDNGSTAYMYLGKTNPKGEPDGIIDHIWIYNMISPPIEECKEVFILWEKDSSRSGIIVDDECWGIFDLKNWRKINAPRIKNAIQSLPLEIWENGISNSEGEPIKALE